MVNVPTFTVDSNLRLTLTRLEDSLAALKTDVWFQALCEEYGNMHSDDRFVSCGSLGDTMFTQGMLPNYNIPHVFSNDKGPVIRGFSPRYIESWMTPRRLSVMQKQEGIKNH